MSRGWAQRLHQVRVILFPLLHLNSHAVVESLTSCTFADKWGSLRVWERRELIRGLRSVLPLLWYTLVNTHRLSASEGLLEHLRQYTTAWKILIHMLDFLVMLHAEWQDDRLVNEGLNVGFKPTTLSIEDSWVETDTAVLHANSKSVSHPGWTNLQSVDEAYSCCERYIHVKVFQSNASLLPVSWSPWWLHIYLSCREPLPFLSLLCHFSSLKSRVLIRRS